MFTHKYFKTLAVSAYVALGILIQTMSVFASDQVPASGKGTILPGSGTGTIIPGSGKQAQDAIALTNPLGSSTIIGFFTSIVDVLLVFAIPLIVFFIMSAGFKYVTARGNAKTIQEAHNALLYALIGGVLILGAHALLVIVQGTVQQFTS